MEKHAGDKKHAGDRGKGGDKDLVVEQEDGEKDQDAHGDEN